MREGVRVRGIANDEGNRLLRIVRRSSGSVATWRRAQMVLLSAQGMDVGQIANVAFTSRIGSGRCSTTSTTTALTRSNPRYSGGPTTDFEAKKSRILELYDIADGKAEPADGDPTVVICMDEFGPLNLQPHPGKQWAALSGTHAEAGRAPRRRRRATYQRPHGVRHLLAAYDLSSDRLYGHVKTNKGRTESLAFCRYIRSLHPVRGPHRHRVGQLQTPPLDQDRSPGRRVGGRQQRRTGLRPLLRQLAQPHRGSVHCPAPFRASTAPITRATRFRRE